MLHLHEWQAHVPAAQMELRHSPATRAGRAVHAHLPTTSMAQFQMS